MVDLNHKITKGIKMAPDDNEIFERMILSNSPRIHTSGMGVTLTLCAADEYNHWVELYDDDSEDKCNNTSTPMYGKDPNKVFKKGRKKW